MQNNSITTAHHCKLCPHNCHAARANYSGYCRSGNKAMIASICLHKGEEPPFSSGQGICNVFFAHCNLQCTYCQNWQISDNSIISKNLEVAPSEAAEQMIPYLLKSNGLLGFVSPGHFTSQMKAIVSEVRQMGHYPTIVYNTNAYDKVSTLRGLEGLVDVYLPDYKYADERLARKFSSIKNYPDTAHTAIGEMIRQKGNRLACGPDGRAFMGVLIRHLVLPGFTDNSKKVLERIRNDFGSNVPLSLMAQYYPANPACQQGTLARTLKAEEYREVVDFANELSFDHVFVQTLESASFYRPDFDREDVFY